MPIQWQTVDLPLGQGMDDNSSKAALPPGRPLLVTNGHFGRQGAYTKRSGFDVKLGSDFSTSARLAQYGNHLLNVSAANTVKLNFTNPTTSAISPVGGLTYFVRVFDP